MAAQCDRLGHSDGNGGHSTGPCAIQSVHWRRQNAPQKSLPTVKRGVKIFS